MCRGDSERGGGIVADKTNRFKKLPRYSEIRKDLLDVLERAGRFGAHETDLVDAYMDLWCHFQLLKKDVNTRGVNIVYDNGGGQKGTKRNESLQDELKVSAQMLKIREALGVKDIPTDMRDEEL